MDPEIFFFPPRKAEHADVMFAVLGRALALASRFESMCRALSTLIKLKKDPSPLTSEDSLRGFSDRIERLQLASLTRHVADHIDPYITVFDVLNEARLARNEIVHERALGFEHWAYNENFWDAELQGLHIAVAKVAKGDQLVSYLSSRLTNEPVPTPDRIREYPNMLVAWACHVE